MDIATDMVMEIRRVLDKEPCMMLEFCNGRVYYILKHWKYQRLSLAPKIFLCRGDKPTKVKLSEGKFLYIQGKKHLKDLIRTDYEGEQKSKRSTKRRDTVSNKVRKGGKAIF